MLTRTMPRYTRRRGNGAEMNTNTTRSDARRGDGSAQHQPLCRASHGRRAKLRLSEIGLEDRGEILEDEHRDRRSSGQPRQPGDHD